MKEVPGGRALRGRGRSGAGRVGRRGPHAGARAAAAGAGGGAAGGCGGGRGGGGGRPAGARGASAGAVGGPAAGCGGGAVAARPAVLAVVGTGRPGRPPTA